MKDGTKRMLTYILVTVAGILQILNGLQEGNAALWIVGGVLALTALTAIVVNWE